MAAHIVAPNMLLNPGKAGLMSFPGITAESARTASELLQKNQMDYHGFFSHIGFHNHMVEDLLACYDFGATPANLHSIYNRVKQVQRPRPKVDSKALVDLSDEGAWHGYLGNNDHYVDFLVFFQTEMAEIGWRGMLEKRLFAGTEVADDLFIRCFAGINHAIIRMGSGLEFGLPDLIPEGLALAASSTDWPAVFLQKAEKEAVALKGSSRKSLMMIVNKIHDDKKIRESAGHKNPMLYATLLAAAEDEIISYAAEYHVPEDRIEEKLAESINVLAFILGGAMRKNKEVKIDFFLMHCVTPSIFLTTFIAQDWITPAQKARFLEWKVRFDILTYAAAGAPELQIDEIKKYVPKVPHDGIGNPWLSIIERGMQVEDDGHTIKTVRALVNGERACTKYSGASNDWPVVEEMWWKIGAMSVDSAEGCGDCLGGGNAWVRGAGFDEAWEVFGPRRVYSRANT